MNTYRVGVIHLPGTKANKNFPAHEHLKFTYLENKMTDDVKRKYGNMGFYNSNRLTKYMLDESYTFVTYKEDMVITNYFVQISRDIRNSKDFDFIFVQPVGVTIDQDYVNKLYELIAGVDNRFKGYCYIQSFMSKKDRIKNGITDTQLTYVPFWPDKVSRVLSGTIFTFDTFSRIEGLAVSIQYLNRFDVLTEHYCEIMDIPVVVAPYNFFRIDKEIMR